VSERAVKFVSRRTERVICVTGNFVSVNQIARIVACYRFNVGTYRARCNTRRFPFPARNIREIGITRMIFACHRQSENTRSGVFITPKWRLNAQINSLRCGASYLTLVFYSSSSPPSLSLSLSLLLSLLMCNKFERWKFFLQSTELVNLSRSTRYLKIPATTIDSRFDIIGYTLFVYPHSAIFLSPFEI